MVAEICRRLVLCVAIRNYMCQAKVRVCVCVSVVGLPRC